MRLVAALALFWLCALATEVWANGEIAELRTPFGLAALALFFAGVLCVFGRGLDMAPGIVAALTAAAFAVSLAEFTIREADDTTRYGSLWVPCVLAGALALVRLSSSAWRDDACGLGEIADGCQGWM